LLRAVNSDSKTFISYIFFEKQFLDGEWRSQPGHPTGFYCGWSNRKSVSESIKYSSNGLKVSSVAGGLSNRTSRW